MRTVVIGAGGVGGYFGGMLAKSGKEVSFLEIGERLVALKQKGLTIRTPEGEFHVQIRASSEPEDLRPVDLIIVCVKSYHTEEVSKAILPIVTQSTVIISLQNGIDNEDKIAKIVGKEKTLGGSAYIEAKVPEPGVIEAAGPRRVIIGELEGGISRRVEEIVNFFRSANITCEASQNIRKVLWTKLVFNSAINSLTTITGAGIDKILGCAETRELFIKLMEEVIAVGKASSIDFEDDLTGKILNLAASFGGAKSSMYFDYKRGARLEMEALNNIIVKLGKDLSVPTPFNQTVYALLKLMDSMN